jgi:uncharacterized protein (TIGR03435 family)
VKRAIIGTVLLNCAAWLAFGQPAETPPKFEIADVHVSPKPTSQNQFIRTGPVRNERYEIKYATMVDLVRLAYGVTPDKILGGPSWLEMNHFDILAKVPPHSDADSQKLMLQSLLEERFKLVAHKEDKPLPTYALTMGKKPLLKEADGTEQSGCKPMSSSGGGAPGEGPMIMFSTIVNGSSTPTTIRIGPGMLIEYQCRNMTMAAFASDLRSMMGANVGTNPVIEETGLKGAFNFDLKFSFNISGLALPNDTGERITLAQAVDKQLGLKLEERQVPTPVIIVDSVNEKPGPNPPGIAEALPVPPVPTEFEVASVKTSEPDLKALRRFSLSPGGRLTVSGMTMRFLLGRAFNTNNLNDQIAGIPKWADSDQFEIAAEAPGLGGSGGGPQDYDALAPLLRKLLEDRFGMKYHTEQRPATAYNLVALKPRMKKADPATRTSCKNAPAPAGSPPGSRSLICQNVTMDQFAERLQGMSPELQWPVINASEVEGTYDFTLTYSFSAGMAVPVRAALDGGAAGGAVGAAAPAVAAASDPTGAITILQALEKQLGMKLEPQKRPIPVYVIDHIEQKPTEN